VRVQPRPEALSAPVSIGRILDMAPGPTWAGPAYRACWIGAAALARPPGAPWAGGEDAAGGPHDQGWLGLLSPRLGPSLRDHGRVTESLDFRRPRSSISRPSESQHLPGREQPDEERQRVFGGQVPAGGATTAADGSPPQSASREARTDEALVDGWGRWNTRRARRATGASRSGRVGRSSGSGPRASELVVEADSRRGTSRHVEDGTAVLMATTSRVLNDLPSRIR